MKDSCIEKQNAILAELHRTLSPFLKQHSCMVAGYSDMLARAAWAKGVYSDDPCFTPLFLEHIGEAAYWHDIGKAGISGGIWDLSRPLTQQEYTLVKNHPVLGASILMKKIELISGKSTVDLRDTLTSMAMDACLFHHERWDGGGYPFGLAGADIPLTGRIVAIADAYDSMTALRPYSGCVEPSRALEEIQRCAGGQFDPELAGVFVKIMGENAERGLGACI